MDELHTKTNREYLERLCVIVNEQVAKSPVIIVASHEYTNIELHFKKSSGTSFYSLKTMMVNKVDSYVEGTFTTMNKYG